MGTINLKEPSVQIREKRLGTITGYAGGAEELLTQVKGCGIKDSKRKFSQCIGCNAGHAFCQLSLIQDVAIVNHAPVGCAGDFFGFNFVYRVEQVNRNLPPANGRYFSTCIEEKDTVFGAAAKLEETVREAFRRVHPKAIFVTTSCASGIIGEDIESVLDSLEKELEIPVVSCSCEGFRSKTWTTGFDAAYHAVLRKIAKPARKKTNKVLVPNFWGSHVFDNFLKDLGYEAQYIMPFSTIKELEHISEAAATIHICPSLSSYMGAGLEQVYGVPEVQAPPAYGVKGTDIWMRNIGKVLNRVDEVESYIKRRHEQIEPKLAEYRKQFEGKRAYVTAGAAHGHAIIALLSELGFVVEAASIFHHDPVYDNHNPESDALAQVVEEYGDIKKYHVCNKQAFELVNALRRVQPDLLVARHSGMTVWGAKLGIPTLLVGDEQFGIGYRGVLNYASRIEEALDAVEFVTNLSKHSTMPYTKWWLDQQPQAFQGGKKKCQNI
ncbi:MAG: nitrogenase component 1 [Lachnospiraceae bacterium]